MCVVCGRECVPLCSGTNEAQYDESPQKLTTDQYKRYSTVQLQQYSAPIAPESIMSAGYVDPLPSRFVNRPWLLRCGEAHDRPYHPVLGTVNRRARY